MTVFVPEPTPFIIESEPQIGLVYRADEINTYIDFIIRKLTEAGCKE